MVQNKKPTGRTSSMPKGLVVGGVTSLGITLLGALILAILVNKGIAGENRIGYGVMVILVLASFAGAMISWLKIKRRRLIVCMASGGVYFGILLSITALFFGGQYSAVGETALLIVCGCGLAVLTGLQENRVGKHRSMKSRYR